MKWLDLDWKYIGKIFEQKIKNIKKNKIMFEKIRKKYIGKIFEQSIE